jgi:hypothetical protein
VVSNTSTEEGREKDMMDEGEREVEMYVCDCEESFSAKTACWNYKKKCKVYNVNSFKEDKLELIVTLIYPLQI